MNTFSMKTALVGVAMFACAIQPSYANRTGDVVGALVFGGLVGAAMANSRPTYAAPVQQQYSPAPVTYVQPAPIVVQQPSPQCFYPASGSYGPCPAAVVAPQVFAPSSVSYYSTSPAPVVEYRQPRGRRHNHHRDRCEEDWEYRRYN